MTTHDLSNPTPNSGDQLRDEAANLLQFRYGTAKTEFRADGKKADIYVEFDDLGRRRRLYVEAKDYDRHLTRSEVVHIWSDYHGVLQKNAPSDLLIITRNGLSTDSESYVNVEQTNLRHKTIWELERDLLGLTEYTRHLANVNKSDGLDKYYIRATAHKVHYPNPDLPDFMIDQQRLDLSDLVENWVNDLDKRPLAILGGYGAGKTSFSRSLVSHFAKKSLSDVSSRIPVLIRLGSFSRYSSIDGLLAGMFGQEFPVPGFNVQLFLQKNLSGRFVIVCDGFDEMKHAMTWSDFRSTVAEINKLSQGFAKIILLGRPNAFLSDGEKFQILKGRRKLHESYLKIPELNEFEELIISDFSDDERAQFVRSYFEFINDRFGTKFSSEEQVGERIEDISNIIENNKDIFSKPVHTKILIDLASDRNFNPAAFLVSSSRWQLYESFFGMLAERESAKEVRRPIDEKERMNFIQEIAYWLWCQRDTDISFSATDIPEYILNDLDDGGTASIEVKIREYLTAAFLEKNRAMSTFLATGHLQSLWLLGAC